MSVLCRNGTFDLVSKTFQTHNPTGMSIPVSYTDFHESHSDVVSTRNLLEQYVGNEAHRDRLIDFVRKSLIMRRQPVGRLYTIFGYGNNGKTTFLNIFKRLLGDMCVTLGWNFISNSSDTPEVRATVQDIVDSPATVAVALEIPPDNATYGFKELLDKGVHILFPAYEDVQPGFLDGYNEPQIVFDSQFVYEDHDSDARRFPVVDIDVQQFLEPLLWIVCNE